jgi:lipopolysaccharide/colanic/teichoic acid biosynthesis glycosyltransferase
LIETHPKSLRMVNALVKARLYGLAMQSLRGQQRSWRAQELHAPKHMRRLADLVIAWILLAFTGPLILLVALAIKWESAGPVLDRRTCIGCGGRRFNMLTFRTMMHDPEQTLPIWARKTTRIGEFLRYSRIEALPQLVNVLHGEMSMIDQDGRSPSFLD